MANINSELKDILDKYDNKINLKDMADAEKRNGKKRLSENQEFLIQFDKLCIEVIRPIMESIGNLLKEYGHEYNFFEKKGNGDVHTKDADSSFSIEIYPYPYKRDQLLGFIPFISIHTDLFKREIYVRESSQTIRKGGSYGVIGSYKIDKIKPEFVQETILSLLIKIF